MQKLTLQQINPLVRGANYASMTMLKFGPRINYGYQLFYVLSGTGKGRINENNFDLYPGLITVYGPGDVHEFKSYSSESMNFATIYFSWEEIDAKRMATTNDNVSRLSDEYWELADSRISVIGLPKIPFILEIPAEERLKLEVLLRDVGNNFSKSADSLLQLKYKATLLEIIYELIKLHRHVSGHVEHYIIRRFKKYIEKKYIEELNRANVSHYLRISESYLTALLSKEISTNFTGYLTSIRMQKAMELLQYSNLSIKEIAASVGFRDYNYFVARFRQLHTKPPSAFR